MESRPLDLPIGQKSLKTGEKGIKRLEETDKTSKQRAGQPVLFSLMDVYKWGDIAGNNSCAD